MRNHSYASRTTRNTVDGPSRHQASDAHAVALAPPAYGIDFVDRGASSGATVQRVGKPEEVDELLHGASGAAQRQVKPGTCVQLRQAQPQAPSRTGMPASLTAGIEALSGIDLSDVRVHADSVKPARIHAFAYAQGSDIHLGPGQERHLPHEAWHIVQQRQGRVRPTTQAAGVQINDDKGLEHEADSMGRKAEDSCRGAASSERRIDSPPGGTHGAQGPDASTAQRVNKNVTATAARRLNEARDAVNYTKGVMVAGAGNQRPALQAGNVNPYFRMKVMRDERPPTRYGHVYLAPPYWQFTTNAARTYARNNPADYVKAKALLAGGGNCGEHADVAYSYLRVNAVGEKIAKCSVDGLDHAFVLIGDLRTWIGDADSDIVAADPWPTQGKATLWEDHFAYTSWHMDINQNRSMVADGQDVEPLITAGLQLTPAGQQVITETLTGGETTAFINAGTAPGNNWIWNHANAAAANKLYDHFDPTGAAVGN